MAELVNQPSALSYQLMIVMLLNIPTILGSLFCKLGVFSGGGRGWCIFCSQNYEINCEKFRNRWGEKTTDGELEQALLYREKIRI